MMGTLNCFMKCLLFCKGTGWAVLCTDLFPDARLTFERPVMCQFENNMYDRAVMLRYEASPGDMIQVLLDQHDILTHHRPAKK